MKAFLSVKTKKKTVHPELSFNVILVVRKEFINHLGLYLDEGLSFAKHVRESIIKEKRAYLFGNLFLIMYQET